MQFCVWLLTPPPPHPKTKKKKKVEKVEVNTMVLASAPPTTVPSMGPETILNLTVLESPKLE